MKEFKLNENSKITSGFTTPEGYFDQFTIELNNKLNLTNTEIKVVSIQTKRVLTLVAAIVVVALSVSVYSKIIISNSEENNTTENYITNHSEICQYDLLALLDKNDIENLSIELNNNNSKNDDEFVNSNDLYNYLTE
jgi:hypothetical protein